MGIAIAVAFLLALFIEARAVLAVKSGGGLGMWWRVMYFVVFAASVIAAYLTAFRYEYYSNPNTRFVGWPVPHVIFQRADATSPWLDYIGPTVMFAFPMNLVLYLLPPSIVVLIVGRRRLARRVGGTGA